MEIKVICDCGTKFKFEITPIRGKMPFAVNCPNCGADTTAQANAIIAQAQPAAAAPATLVAPATEIAMPPASYAPPPARPQAAPVAYSPAPAAAPAPVAYQPAPAPAPAPAASMSGAVSVGGLRASRSAEPAAAPASSAPPPPAPPPGGGLRINRAAAPEHTSAPPPQAPPPAIPYQRPAAAAPKANKAKNALVTVGSTLVVLVALGLGALKIGGKWYRRIKSVVNVASALSDDSADNSHWNFQYEDAVAIFVQQTNHTAVAEACKDFWRDKLHRPLIVTAQTEDYEMGDQEYAVIASYNGYVRILGQLNWKAQEYEALSQHLSQRFGGVVFETAESDFSGAYHFGVYEAGTRKFHATMEVKVKGDDFDEVVNTEGNDWAQAHGFNPKKHENGFKDFNMADADEISQQMGLKMWDEPEGRRVKALLLKEAKGIGNATKQ